MAAAVANWGSLPKDSHAIRSSIVLPPSRRFEDFATEVIKRPTGSGADLHHPEVQAGMVHAGVMGLAIHDLPLVRALLPRFDDLVVHGANALAPFGYQIVLTAGGRRVVLHATMSATWQPEWVLDAYSDHQALHVEFPPSYVHAGSAVATLRTATSSQTWGPATHNGYEGEWRDIAALVRGEKEAPPTAELIDDLRFAMAVADTAADLIRTRHHEGTLATTPVTIYATEGAQSPAATVLASLPLSYAPGEGAEGSVAIVSGSADWPTTAIGALDAGAVAAIIVQPEPADVETLQARAALVALDTRWATNPVVASASTPSRRHWLTALTSSAR